MVKIYHLQLLIRQIPGVTSAIGNLSTANSLAFPFALFTDPRVGNDFPKLSFLICSQSAQREILERHLLQRSATPPRSSVVSNANNRLDNKVFLVAVR